MECDTMSSSYPPRTRWNVRHADFVMLITRDGIGNHRGTKLTMDMANNYGVRWGMVNLHDESSRSRAMAFIRQASHARNDYRIMIADLIIRFSHACIPAYGMIS